MSAVSHVSDSVSHKGRRQPTATEPTHADRRQLLCVLDATHGATIFGPKHTQRLDRTTVPSCTCVPIGLRTIYRTFAAAAAAAATIVSRLAPTHADASPTRALAVCLARTRARCLASRTASPFLLRTPSREKMPVCASARERFGICLPPPGGHGAKE